MRERGPGGEVKEMPTMEKILLNPKKIVAKYADEETKQNNN